MQAAKPHGSGPVTASTKTGSPAPSAGGDGSNTGPGLPDAESHGTTPGTPTHYDLSTLDDALRRFSSETAEPSAAPLGRLDESRALRLAVSAPSQVPTRTMALSSDTRQQLGEDLPDGMAARKLTLIWIGSAAVVAVVLLLLSLQSSRSTGSPAQSVTTMGTASFETKPSGVEVAIDGTPRGTTPLKLSLPIGQHVVELGRGADKRTLNVAVTANAVASHYMELAGAGAGGAAEVGRLEVLSEPTGAQVSVDGIARGATPLTLASIPVGQHSISVSQGGSTVNRTVQVTAGSTASIVTALGGTAAAAGGWVAIRAPFEMKIFKDGSLLGTTLSDRTMVPAGAHAFDLVSDAMQFKTRVSVNVSPGRTETVTVKVPSGSLSINALPWAEVWIDGRSVGTTPLGNLSVPIGPHEVVWRHPQLGERKNEVVVTTDAPVRIGVDFAQ